MSRKFNWDKVSKNTQMYTQGTESVDQLPKKIDINIGVHKGHDWQVVLEPTGPHAGKIICNTCKGKFVNWIPQQYARLIRQK